MSSRDTVGKKADVFARVRSFLNLPLTRIGLVGVALVVAASLTQPAHAAIAFRAASSANNAGGATTLVINAPAAKQGDVLIAVISARGGTGTTITPPTIGSPYAWNAVTNGSADDTTNLKSTTYYKTFNSGETSYTFTFNATQKASGVIAAYSGVNQATPVNVANSVAKATATALSGNSVTTTVGNTLIVGAFSSEVDATYTQGTNFSSRGSDKTSGNGATSRTGTFLEDYNTIQVAAGASVTPTATGSTTAPYIAHTLALTPAPVLDHVAYRWFNDSATPGQVGAPLAAQDTAAMAPLAGTPFRLRLVMNDSLNSLPTTAAFKLQYKWTGGTTCDGTGTFTDVGAAADISYYNGAGTDGQALSSSANDPTKNGAPVYETYEENGTVATTSAIAVGQDGLWDFSLTMNTVAMPTGQYYLQLVDTQSGGVVVNTTTLPAIKALRSAASLGQDSVRAYSNTDSSWFTPRSR